MCIAHSASKVGYYRVMSKDGDDTISNVDNNLKIFSEVSSYSIPPIPITDKKNMDLKQNFSDLAKTYYDYWLDYNNTHNEDSLKEMEYIKSIDKEFCEIVNVIINENKNHRRDSSVKNKLDRLFFARLFVSEQKQIASMTRHKKTCLREFEILVASSQQVAQK